MESHSAPESALKNVDRLPPEVVPVLNEHVGMLARILGPKLVGVYVHGSVAMGGFNPKQSDLDYLAVVSAPLTPTERHDLSGELAKLHGASGFRKGVEMSIVEERFAGRDFEYPTPYEFHMGSLEQVRHHATPHQMKHLDSDLASHFSYTRERGICVYGREISNVFAPIEQTYFDQSTYADLKDARELILKDPVYVILNLARALYQLEDGKLYSKAEGAARYLANVNDQDDLVRQALADYETGETSVYDQSALNRYADQMLTRIQGHTHRAE